MGCGSLSTNTQILTPQLQFRKIKSYHKNEQSQIWTCQDHNKQKFCVKVFKKIFLNDDNTNMLKNFQQEINRLYSLTYGSKENENGKQKQNQKGMAMYREKQKQKENPQHKDLNTDHHNNKILNHVNNEVSYLNHLNSEKNNASKHLMPYIKAWKDQNNNLCLIMKYIQQKSLGQQVKGRLPGLFNETIVSKITQQILQTIQYLRKNGSIFCNFKPSNVFLLKPPLSPPLSKQPSLSQSLSSPSSPPPPPPHYQPSIILTDYYNLQQYFKLSPLNNIHKNPFYSAPQNILFNQYFKQSDVWRVGCFIIEMLTCIKPWYRETTDTNKIIENLKKGNKPILPQKISSSCRNFLEKCFQTDHNRRIKLEELLRHQWIRENKQKTVLMPKVDNQFKYSRENTSNEEIGSYNIEVQLIEPNNIPANTTKLNSRNSRNSQISRNSRNNHPHQHQQASEQPMIKLQPKVVNIQQLSSPLMEKKKRYLNQLSRKKSNSNYVSDKRYEISQVISAENDENVQTLAGNRLQKAKNFRSKKRMKTDWVHGERSEISQVGENSPYTKPKNAKDILRQTNNKAKQFEQQNPYDSPKRNYQTAPRKLSKNSKTSNFRLSISKSKKRIQTNRITLNNQIIEFKNVSQSKHQKSPQLQQLTTSFTPFDYIQTAQKINKIMKQIQQEGGIKYYKKPLKLLKQKMKVKTSLRTQTSITLEDSRLVTQGYDQQQDDDIDQVIELQATNNQNNLTTQSELNVYHNTQNSALSNFNNSRDDEIIQTLASKAHKIRYQTQKKLLYVQRQNEKKKWQKQLKQGQQLMKRQLNNRYYVNFQKAKVKQIAQSSY